MFLENIGMKIKELDISASRFEEQVAFYAEIIGLPIVGAGRDETTFQVGRSKLTLQRSSTFKPYHFAFNIPSNQEFEALEWLKGRVAILTYDGHEIQDFTNWNAKAIYFYDEDQNIVEFIARKNLSLSGKGNFNAQSLVEISEIGMPVENIEEMYASLSERVPLDIYDGNFEKFCAIGDENGLFICVNRRTKDWFPTNDKACSSDFKIDFEQGEKNYHFTFENGSFV